MNDHAKYIVIADGSLPLVVVFNPILSHREMAGAKKVVSAGFCYFSDRGYIAYGESVTLGIKSRGDFDGALIDAQILGEY
jgi:hypothetical protein